MEDNEFLEKLFLKYKPTLEAFNDVTSSFYSDDEYKIRHKLFKKIYGEYKAYKFNLWLKNFKEKIKQKFSKFKIKNLQVKADNSKKKNEKIIKAYNELMQKMKQNSTDNK